MRNIIKNTHWFIGITLGAFLSISGLTGGLMAFGPELSSWANNINHAITISDKQTLSLTELHPIISSQVDQYRISKLTVFADKERAGQVELIKHDAVAAPGQPIRPELHLFNPYDGQMIEQPALGIWMDETLHFLREIHQGHWFAPSHPLSTFAWKGMSWGAVGLFLLALSGLYLRWPKRRARDIKSWLYINRKLKGRALLRNIHLVMGTGLFIVYLVTAHTGVFQSAPIKWYGNTIRASLGQEIPVSHWSPPGESVPHRLFSQVDIDPLIHASGTMIGIESMSLLLDQRAELQIKAGDSELNIYAEDKSGNIIIKRTNQALNEENDSFGHWLVDNNQSIHEGRWFGTTGVIIMMIAAFSLPGFYITGWIMYLKSRRK